MQILLMVVLFVVVALLARCKTCIYIYIYIYGRATRCVTTMLLVIISPWILLLRMWCSYLQKMWFRVRW